MIYEHTQYRDYLKAWLALKIADNPAFSMRAMARKLGMAPTSLSEVLRGIKGLSAEKAFEVGSRLGLKSDELEYFCQLVEFDRTRNPEARAAVFSKIEARARSARSEVRDLSVDLFQVIAEWYHLPILEMTGLAGFELTPVSAARKLGITAIEAEAALQRLIRLELMEKDAEGRYRKTHSRWVAEARKPDEGLRKFHRQMLEKAIESLTTQTPREKVVGSETMVIDQAQLGQARAIIEECFERVSRLAGQARAADSVYHLGIQFFRLNRE